MNASQINGSLPPNISIPIKLEHIPAFILKINSIRYLNSLPQNSQNTSPNSFPRVSYSNFKWWGQSPDRQNQQLQQFSETYQYMLAVSKPMFIRYCSDMKILQIEMRDSVKKHLYSVYINFMVVDKIWNGQLIDVVADIKSKISKDSKKSNKIGQVEVSMEIVEQVPNPYFKGFTNKQPVTGNQESHKKTVQKNSKPTTIDKHQSNSQIKRNYNSNSISESSYSSSIHHNSSLHQQFDKPIRKPVHKPEKQQAAKSSCICDDLNPAKYQLQKLTIMHQFNKLLEIPSFSPSNTQQVILQLQLLYYQPLNSSKLNIRTRVEWPIIDQAQIIRNNSYFQKGKGYLVIDVEASRLNRQQMEKYLNEDLILEIEPLTNLKNSILCGYLPIYRVMNGVGQILAVRIQEQSIRKKKGEGILRGHYFIKVSQKNNPVLPLNHQKQETDIKEQKQSDIISYEYVWVLLKGVHFLQPQLWKNSNTYIRTHLSQQMSSLSTQPHQSTLNGNTQEIVSKVIWKNENPTFNQLITIPYQPNHISFDHVHISLWDKQKNDRIIGVVILEQLIEKIKRKRDSYMGELQLPICDIKGVVLGYLGACFGRGGLTEAAFFLRTHHNIMKSNNNQQNPQKQITIEPQNHEQEKESSRNESQQPSQNSEMNLSIKSRESSHIPNINPNRPNFSELDITQIHNKLFHKYKSSSNTEKWLSNQIDEKDYMITVSQLQSLVGDKLDNMSKAKLSSFYLDSRSNRIELTAIKQSYQAFLVYYQSLIIQRNQLLGNFLEILSQQSYDIHSLESNLARQPTQSNRNHDDIVWIKLKSLVQTFKNYNRRQIKQIQIFVENLRFFYEGFSQEAFCDQLRRFQVYQTSARTQIPLNAYKYEVRKQIWEILEIDNGDYDPQSSAILHETKERVRDMGIELSRWENLILFGEQPQITKIDYETERQYKMIKSPTFGVLGTDRLMGAVNRIQHNPSIAAQMKQKDKSEFLSQQSEIPPNKNLDSLKIESQSFFKNDHYLKNNPISPINKNHMNQPKNQPFIQTSQQYDSAKTIDNPIALHLSNLDSPIQDLYINNRHYDLLLLTSMSQRSGKSSQRILLDFPKSRRYTGVVILADGSEIQLEGEIEEWIALVDADQIYRGGIMFS